jgi:hypothetical protein
MHADEKAILDYMKGWPHSFVSGREIARKVCGKKRYEDDRGWAVPHLAQLVQAGLLETDHLGYFKLLVDESKKHNVHRHVSPQLLKILKTSGKSFDGIAIDSEDDAPISYRKAGSPKPGDKRS